MSTILMSIKPEYVNKIFSGKKKYEYRKIKCKNIVDKIIVYSSPVQNVVGELIIKQVLYDNKKIIWDKTGVSSYEISKYLPDDVLKSLPTEEDINLHIDLEEGEENE